MKIAPDAPVRPALRYHGAKWRLAPWIIRHLPAHELYCEPFGGSAAVLLRKERSYLEVLNDLASEVVNFFRVLRDQPGPFIQAVELTPFAKEEWLQAFKPADEPVEQARRFYIRAYMSIAGATAQWNTGWRRQKVLSRGSEGEKKMTPAAISFMRIEHLWTIAARLRGVTIEQDTARAIIERYDGSETLFYLDPPYVPATRGRWKEHAYAEEMSADDHRELAAALRGLEGMAVLSGYGGELYEELFPDWRRLDREARINGPGSATESLWFNAAAWRRLMHNDLPLFAFGS